MASDSELTASKPASKPDRCDGLDHGVSPERKLVLEASANAINQKLKAAETDEQGRTHVESAEEAGEAFYKELIHLPIGERRELLKLALNQNQVMTEADKAMPAIKVKMDSTAFIDNLTIRYPEPFNFDEKGRPKEFAAEFLVYQGWGMCAEFKQHDWLREPATEKPWFEFNPLRLRKR